MANISQATAAELLAALSALSLRVRLHAMDGSAPLDTNCQEMAAAAQAMKLAAADQVAQHTWTILLREEGNTGTTFITSATADTMEAAVTEARYECAGAWRMEEDPDGDTLHLLGVLPGDINAIEWDDSL